MIKLTPGESFQTIFKVKVLPGEAISSPSKRLKDMESFADLQFSWFSRSTSINDEQ